MFLWTDGRSRRAGCFVGNLVLGEIARTGGGQLRRRRGTEFESSTAIYCGRTCGTDAYLTPPLRNWVNLSRRQHDLLKQHAESSDRQLIYLLATGFADRSQVEYWLVPGAIVDDILENPRVAQTAETLGVHLVNDGTNYLLQGHDVTAYHHVIRLSAAQSAEFEQALQSDSSNIDRNGVGHVSDRKALQELTGTHPPGPIIKRRFEIPLSQGRVGYLDLPVPIDSNDIDRIKRYLDAVGDVLQAA